MQLGDKLTVHVVVVHVVRGVCNLFECATWCIGAFLVFLKPS